MRVAIVGRSHGELDKIYETIEYIETTKDLKIDLLLCCGDFQSIRNYQDLKCLACPAKYRELGCFHAYYSGLKKAPVMTIFIGGNHEASNYLQELHYGGYVAENIFYLGSAGAVKFAGLRISGISGIYKQHDYTKGQFESYPYTESTLRSVYHIREYQIFQLAHLKSTDIFLSHDWPRGITEHGDVEDLLRKKSFLRQEIQNNTFGNPATQFLLHKIQPKFWFSAHLHVKFPAIVSHANGQETKFLALDKPLPKRQFLQVLEIPSTGPLVIEMDPEWLTIVKATHHLATTEHSPPRTPEGEFTIDENDIQQLKEKIQHLNQGQAHDMQWPFPFHQTTVAGPQEPTEARGNPQTDGILQLLQLTHKVTRPYTDQVVTAAAEPSIDPSEIDIDDL